MSAGAAFQAAFKEVNWAKFGGAMAVGATIGGAYSLFDQTVLHRKKASAADKMPGVTDFLNRCAPDIVRKMQQFYLYRNVIVDERRREAFRNYCAQVLEQSEYVAAIYNRVACQDDFVEPTMQILALNQQLKAHTRIAVQLLRLMLAAIGRVDDVKVETAFNEVYECFHNRVFTVESKFRA
jgi:hypothetical protein